MITTIIGLVAAAVCGATPTNGQAVQPPRWVRFFRGTDSDDPVLDGYRRRQERARQPGWLDQKMELRNTNGFQNYWF